jgi:hypothetical protein
MHLYNVLNSEESNELWSFELEALVGRPSIPICICPAVSAIVGLEFM